MNSVHPASVGSPVPGPLGAPKSEITEKDRMLSAELDQILISKNDNDPRLDSDFRHLTDGTKRLLMQKYENLPLEARNERGTIVFLIGRELTRPADCQFLAHVVSEQPCLSLSDCARAPSHSDEDVHEEAAMSITLAYPQHVAVKSMESFLDSPAEASLVESCLSSLDAMTESPIAPIAQKSSELRSRFASKFRH